jgi:hypothetical protein
MVADAKLNSRYGVLWKEHARAHNLHPEQFWGATTVIIRSSSSRVF